MPDAGISSSMGFAGAASTDLDLASWLQAHGLSDAHRAFRLDLDGGADADPRADVDAHRALLLPQAIDIEERLCGPLRLRILCVSPRADLSLKRFTGLPVGLRIVTDRGALRSICAIVTRITAGQSDGGLHTLMLEATDGLTLLEQRVRSRVFQGLSVPEIAHRVLTEWVRSNPVVGRAFGWKTLALDAARYPRREFVHQHNESDAAFLRRLLASAGISWVVHAGRADSGPASRTQDPTPAHTLVLFDDAMALPQSAAGSVRYHREGGATEPRDTVTLWSATRRLVAGAQARHSWDYKRAGTMRSDIPTLLDQGESGNALAGALRQSLVETPHAADDDADHRHRTTLRMQRLEHTARQVNGAGGVRDFTAGSWFELSGHPVLEGLPVDKRRHVLTEVRHTGWNNLPKTLERRLARLFAASGWALPFFDPGAPEAGDAGTDALGGVRYANTFVCVRRDAALVPAFDPRLDWPRLHPTTAIVVGPEGEEVHTDALGRLKVRFHGLKPEDHVHAHGAGTSGSDRDSAWVRQATPLAGSRFGQYTPHRVGDEVVVEFLDGDPDKPLVTGAVHRPAALPAAFSDVGSLPGNRYVAGIKTQEIQGQRHNQLRLDDTPGQISAQLASGHAHSQLNLGWLTQPRDGGRGQPRGEGAELRSDDSVAIRAAKALLISAWKRLGASDHHLSRQDHLALMQDCLDLFKSLGDHAARHQGLPVDAGGQQALHGGMRQWEAGSNTDPEGRDGGAPSIAVTAPEGIALTTPKTVLTHAGVNLDGVAQRNVQFAAGQRVVVNAGQGIGLFAHGGGLSAIAHQGPLALQSQHDDTLLDAARHVQIRAAENVVVSGKTLSFVAEDGSFLRIGGGGITLGSNGAIAQKAASFTHSGPATLAGEAPAFGKGKTDQRFRLHYGDVQSVASADERVVAAGRRYEITLGDGSVHRGTSDDEGRTSLLESDAMHIASIVVFRD